MRILIDGIVGYETDYREFRRALGAAKGQDIVVEINSVGGSVRDGLAIFQALTSHQGNVDIVITGYAASIASCIAMAGSEGRVLIAPTAMMMVHNPRGAVVGEAKGMRKVADTLDKHRDAMLKTYARRINADDADFLEKLDAETWFTAEEAVEYGLADAVLDDDDASAVLTEKMAEYISENYQESKLPDSVRAECAKIIAQAKKVENPVEKNPKGGEKMTDKTIDEAKTDETGAAEAQPDVIAATGTAAGLVSGHEDVIRIERERVRDIRALFEPHGDEHTALLNTCIDEGLTATAAGEKLLAKLGETTTSVNDPSHIRVEVVPDDRFESAMTDCIEMVAMQTKGVSFDAETRQKAHDNELFGLTPTDMARIYYMKQIGSEAMTKPKAELWAMALQTSSIFPTLLTQSVRRVLLRWYQEQVEVFDMLARVYPVPDFKETTLARRSAAPTLKKLREHGEYQAGSLSEETGSFQTQSWGEVIGLTREALINDDLGGLAGISADLGMAAKRTMGDEFIEFLTGASSSVVLGGGNLFVTANTVTSADIDRAGLRAVKSKMRRRTGAASEHLNLQGRYLFVPTEREDEAMEAMGSQTSLTSTRDATTMNVYRGRYEVLSDARLDDKSTDAWYLFADPNVAPVIGVAMLMGATEPFIDTMPTWNIDGIEWKVRHEFNFFGVDNRGAAKSNG